MDKIFIPLKSYGLSGIVINENGFQFPNNSRYEIVDPILYKKFPYQGEQRVALPWAKMGEQDYITDTR